MYARSPTVLFWNYKTQKMERPNKITDKPFFSRTAFKKIPAVEGKEIDLYLLYWLVTAQGGWEKVSCP